MITLKIKKGDNVMIIAGKDSGKSGKVTEVFPRTQRVIIEGLNQRKRVVRARKQGEKNQIITASAPTHVSNTMLLCPRCGKKTRVGFSVAADGTKQRQCKQCQATFA